MALQGKAGIAVIDLISSGHPSVESSIQSCVLRYRGFVLVQEPDMSWQVRPERSPMHVLPFRAPACSVADVKALIDWRLARLGRDRRPRVDLLPSQQNSKSGHEASPSERRLQSIDRRSA